MAVITIRTSTDYSHKQATVRVTLCGQTTIPWHERGYKGDYFKAASQRLLNQIKVESQWRT